MARAHEAYKNKHGINCNPEILMTPPAVAGFLLPELDSEMELDSEFVADTPAVVNTFNTSHHRKRRVSEPVPAQTRPMPKRPRVRQRGSAPAQTRPKAKAKAKGTAKVSRTALAFAAKRRTKPRTELS